MYIDNKKNSKTQWIMSHLFCKVDNVFQYLKCLILEMLVNSITKIKNKNGSIPIDLKNLSKFLLTQSFQEYILPLKY